MNGRNGRTLADLAQHESGVLESLDLPEDLSERLMQVGFIPGATIQATYAAPGGGPRVYSVEGVDIALRRETARSLKLR